MKSKLIAFENLKNGEYLKEKKNGATGICMGKTTVKAWGKKGNNDFVLTVKFLLN